MAVSYSQCPSNVKVSYKVPSNTDKYKKTFSGSVIKFVGTVITGCQNQFPVCVQNMFNTTKLLQLWTLIVDIQYQNVVLWIIILKIY